ncbi:MAG: T9SS type A sorting domain-containing protein, partial [Chitinophagales bacterium]
KGFDEYTTLDTSHVLLRNNLVGDWFSYLNIDANGNIYASGQDSIYVFDHLRDFNSIESDYRMERRCEWMMVDGNFLFEEDLDAPNQVRLSLLSNFPQVDSLYQLPQYANSQLKHVQLWGNHIYTHTFYGTNFFDVSDPYNIVNEGWGDYSFVAFSNDVLFQRNSCSADSLQLYQAGTFPPVLLKSEQVNFPLSCYFSETQLLYNLSAPVLNGIDFDFNSGRIFQLNLDDTANLHFSASPLQQVQDINWDLDKIWIHDSIMYWPYGNYLFYYDMCDTNHFRQIDTFFTKSYIKDILLVDTFLFLNYGGYVERLSVSSIHPCQVVTAALNIEQPENYLSLFPNPADNFITITPSSLIIDRLEIYNSLGITLRTESNPAFPFEISALSPGMYFCRVTVKGKVMNVKFISQ